MAKKIKVRTRARNKKGEGNSFFRAGIEHTPEWAVHEVDEETLEVLEAEPMIEVAEADEEEPGEKPTEKLNAQEMIARIKKAETQEELESLWIEGEGRSTVIDAYNAKQQELVAAATEG